MTIQAPFTDYRGSTWTQTLIDTYNRFDAEVEKRERRKPPRGSLAHKELEFYRDQRHKQFEQCADIAQDLKRKSTAPAARTDYEVLP